VSQRVLRIALVEDRAELRDGLRALLHGTPGFSVSGVFPNMERALRELERVLPDAVLMDLGLPGMSGIEGIRVLRERHPELKLVALTVHDDDGHIFDAL